jgi:hypothetical protein
VWCASSCAVASRRTRINRAGRAIRTHVQGLLDGVERVIAADALDAAGCPDLMGAKEVAAELGTSVPNLRAVRDLPEAVAEVAATRLWDADEIRRFARERKRKAVGAGGMAPHREHRKRRG